MSNDVFVKVVSEATFAEEVLAQSGTRPVVADFWAPWCGPCRVLGPILERLAHDARGAFVLAKINVDENPGLAMRYEVQGIPAVKAFRDGQVVDGFVGAQPEGRVREFLRKVAPTAADQALEAAKGLLAIRQWARAEAALRQVLADQPQSSVAMLGLVKALLAQGRGCEAAEKLDELPAGDQAPLAETLKPLAQLLCEVETPDGVVADTDLDAQYYQSARLLARGQMEAGMDGLLEVVRQDKRYRKGEPRLVMVALFGLLGEDDPTTRQYRGELASALY
jgi:putative thioredoxin